MYKILLIEDESAYIKILKDTFEKASFEVLTAMDGRQGVIESLKHTPDFILLDLMIPDVSGTSVLRHIQHIPQLQKVPLAILTNVPEGVPQNIEGKDLFKDIVAYWVKDETSLSEIVKNVRGYLDSKDRGIGKRVG